MSPQVGDVAIACVHDADIHLTPEELFLDWDEDAAGRLARELGPAYYDPVRRLHTLPVHCWLLRTGSLTILVDAGCGDDKRREAMPELHLLHTGFLARLAAAGARPEDVDVVLCTHLHVDHVGWNTRLADGRWVPTFPNARYLVARAELAHARETAAGGGLAAEVYRDSVEPVVESGQVVQLDGVHRLDEAITILPAPGHTPGHVVAEVRSGGELAVLSGDIVHTPLQGRFWHWRTALASDARLDVRTRRALLERCAADDALLLPAHFHLPGSARVRTDGDGFSIEPASLRAPIQEGAR